MSIKTTKEGSEKALPRCADLFAQVPGSTSPPLPARRPNLFDATCATISPGPWRNPREIECADHSSPALIRNRIVNLTLTTQNCPWRRQNAPAAWTLQRQSCKTIRGIRVHESGTDVSLPAAPWGKAEL